MIENVGVDSALERILHEGHTAWPTLHVPDAEFLAYVMERAGTDLAEARAGDLYLACGCARGDEHAIELFERNLFGDVSVYVGKVDASLIDDARQQLRIRLLVGHDGKPPQIVKYSGTGALGGWLRMACVRVVRDLQRAQKAHMALDPNAERHVDIAANDPELGYMKERHGKELSVAFTTVLNALPPEERNILALRYLDGISTDAIATMLGLDGSTVRRRLTKLRETILDETRAVLAEKLRLSESECDSLIALMRSQIAVSVARYLR